MFGKGGERRFRAEIRLIDSGACGPGFFRAALSALNSQTKLRVGDTTRNQKSMVGKGGERRFRAEIRLIDSGACGPGFFRAALSALNSQTKLRVGDTTRNQKSMVGKGEERRFRAEIRLGDSGVCAWARLFSCCSVCSESPNETSCGRHH